MKKISVILVSLLILNSGFKIDVDTNSKMKAIFIMNFTKLIECPQPYSEDDFIVDVVGDSPLYFELTKMAKAKKVANQSLQIKKMNSVNDINSVVQMLEPHNTLIITEKQGSAEKGAGINFVIKKSRQKFKVLKLR